MELFGVAGILSMRGGRRNPGTLVRALAAALVLLVGLQAACPVVCAFMSRCVTQKAAGPKASESCCDSHPDASANENKAPSPVPYPGCCGSGALLAKASVPDSVDSGADTLRVVPAVAVLFAPAACPLVSGFPSGSAAGEDCKSPPLTRAQLNVYRI